MFVQETTLGGEPVLGPRLLQMDERPLPRAERQVLQAAQRQGIVKLRLRCLHGAYAAPVVWRVGIHSSAVMPSGRSPVNSIR